MGVDIAEVGRIQAAIERHGEVFLRRVYTAKEREYCEQFKNRYERYAGRFAAKEAAMKALGTGWRRGVRWVDLEVVREAGGRPTLALGGGRPADAGTGGRSGKNCRAARSEACRAEHHAHKGSGTRASHFRGIGPFGLRHISQQVISFLIRNAHIQPAVGRMSPANTDFQIIGGERGRRTRSVVFIRTKCKDAESAADLRLAEGGGFLFAKGAEFAGAALDDSAGDFVCERRGFCAGPFRIREDMQIGERQ